MVMYLCHSITNTPERQSLVRSFGSFLLTIYFEMLFTVEQPVYEKFGPYFPLETIPKSK